MQDVITQCILRKIAFIGGWQTIVDNTRNGANDIEASGVLTLGMRSLLKGHQAMALIFSCLNECWTQHYGRPRTDPLFDVDDNEWNGNGSAGPWPSELRVFDCHTHYADQDLRPDGNHFAAVYRQGARGNWWFFPEAYRFWLDRTDKPIATLLQPPPQGLQGDQAFSEFVAEALRYMGNAFELCIMPAPDVMTFSGNGRPQDNADWQHPQQRSRKVAAELNKVVGHTVCHVAGVMDRTTGDPFPAAVVDNPSRVWKVYPPTQSDRMNARYLSNALRQGIAKLAALPPPVTVCIHWWGDDQPFDFGPLRDLVLSDQFGHLNFVIFHACAPFTGNAVFLLRQNKPNVFIEIGGTFGDQILGYTGWLTGDNDVGPRPAINVINSLRGNISYGKGEYDQQIIWGTDAIWNGSPAWQAEAFRRLIVTPGIGKNDPFKKAVLYDNARRAFPAMVR